MHLLGALSLPVLPRLGRPLRPVALSAVPRNRLKTRTDAPAASVFFLCPDPILVRIGE